jgi:hypothetical protein
MITVTYADWNNKGVATLYFRGFLVMQKQNLAYFYPKIPKNDNKWIRFLCLVSFDNLFDKYVFASNEIN